MIEWDPRERTIYQGARTLELSETTPPQSSVALWTVEKGALECQEEGYRESTVRRHNHHLWWVEEPWVVYPNRELGQPSDCHALTKLGAVPRVLNALGVGLAGV